MSKLLAALIIAFTSLSATATTTFTLGSCNFAYGPYASYNPGPTGFDQAVCSFAATNSNSLTMANFGGGHIDPSAHGSTYGVNIDLFANGIWNNVFSSPVYSVDKNFSEFLHQPIDFAALNATQLRFRAGTDQGWSFHNTNSAMTFTLANAAAVPEPATLGLFGLGIAAIAIGRRQRKVRAQAAL